MTEKELEVDIAEALGADGGVSGQCFFVYVPDKDRDGKEIGNQRKWVLQAFTCWARLTAARPPCPPAKVSGLMKKAPKSGSIQWSFTRFYCRRMTLRPTCRKFVSSCIEWDAKRTKAKWRSSSTAASTESDNSIKSEK